MYLFLIFQWLTDLICHFFTKFDIQFGFDNLELSLATRTETVHPKPRAVSRGLFNNEVDMSSKTKFDMGASAMSAAELLFQADNAHLSMAQFMADFTKEIARARRDGADKWGGQRYPGTYGDSFLRSLKANMWPKDATGAVLANEKIGDDILKPLEKRFERLARCAKICFEQELALTGLVPAKIVEANICLYTGNVKGAQPVSEEPKSKGAQPTKTAKHLGYILAPFVNHTDVIRYLGSVSAELRKVKVIDGTALHKALIDVAMKEKFLQGKDGEIKTAK